jgi:hypothetical protein
MHKILRLEELQLVFFFVGSGNLCRVLPLFLGGYLATGSLHNPCFALLNFRNPLLMLGIDTVTPY